MKKCKGQTYFFTGPTSDEFDCVDRCPDGFEARDYSIVPQTKRKGTRTKPERAIKACVKKDARLSDSLVVNRGKRRASLSIDIIKEGTIINKFPDRVTVTGKDGKTTFKKDENGNLMLDEASCQTAALKAKSVGLPRAYGAFAMMANIQRKDSKAKEALVKCRDWAYCALQKETKLVGIKDRDAREKIKERINKKYPGCA